jgi:hypothetical protein
MSRITKAILDQKAYGRKSNQPMLDLSYGGQFGWSPNLTEWVSNQAYVRRNLICILLEAPRFFKLMPEPSKWVESLKSLVELHCRTIDGFNAQLTVDTDTHPVGGAGEMQDEVTDVKRNRSEPSFTFIEKYGLPITTFLYNWITYGLMDPDTKYAMVGTLSGTRPEDMLADWYSMTCLFMEPDPTHTKVIKAWVTTNMYPKSTGVIEGKRDLTVAGEVSTLQVDFTGISQYNIGTKVFAQKILDNINIVNANPNLKPSFIQSISADVNASTEGYQQNVRDLASKQV